MSSNVFYYYIPVGILGSLYIYSFGFKKDWQTLREKNGLAGVGQRLSPGFLTKSTIGKKIYFRICLNLYFWALTIAAIISLLHYSVTEVNVLSTFKTATMGVIELFITYSIFAGAPINKENANISKIYQPILLALSSSKEQIIQGAITREIDIMHSYIDSTLQSWIEESNKEKLSTFIVGLNEGFFMKMLPKNLDPLQKSKIEVFPEEMVIGYKENAIMIKEEMMRLFCEELFDIDVNLSMIVKLIHGHDKRVFSAEDIAAAKTKIESLSLNLSVTTQVTHADQFSREQFDAVFESFAEYIPSNHNTSFTAD